MSDITRGQRRDILDIIRKEFPDATYSTDRQDPIEFDDTCGCYSEYTTENCSLHIQVNASLFGEEKEQWVTRQLAENAILAYAEGHLEWDGCSCCGNYLSVWVRVYPKKVEGMVQ
jgi:hypothetical protein